MIEYIYKGFKISFKVVPAAANKNTYKAEGSVIYLLNMPTSFAPKKFDAEHHTYASTEHEIKALLEHYADVELKNFYALQKKTASKCAQI